MWRRSDFGRLSQLRGVFSTTPMSTLTASTPPKYFSKLADSLFLQNPLQVMSDLDRPNIFIKIHKRKPSFGSESYERIQFERK